MTRGHRLTGVGCKDFSPILVLAAIGILATLSVVWAASPSRARNDMPSLAPMLERVVPSVVSIAIQGRGNAESDPMLSDPFLRKFFGLPEQPSASERSFQVAGSGVIVDAKSGYVLTNSHLLENADEITVTLLDHRSFSAKVIGMNQPTDVAVVQIKADRLTSLPLGARQIAKTFEADLIAVAAAEPSALVSPSESSPLVAEVLRYRTHELEERLKKLKQEFLNVAGNDERASWRAELDDPTRAIALHTRAADLVITGAPTAAAAGDVQRTVDPGALVLSLGRPVLFAADDLAAFKGESVMVAWKDCREAPRAVVDAMPFLRNAKEVTVFSAAEEGRQAARDGAADVVRFLMKHGVKARSQLLESEGTSVGESITIEADRIGADLIVAGGYGRSRFREWAFGGATRSLLKSGSFHRLLSN